MTDLVTTARTARERLAIGLNALQHPGVPPTLLAAAEPIAMAMSSLLQIERSGSLPISKSGPTILDLVRQALAKLQAEPTNHPALITAMESVAGSLGLVFGLVQRMSSAPPAPNPATSSQAVVSAPPVAAEPRVAPMQSVSTAPHQPTQPAQGPAAVAAPRQQAPANQPAPAAPTPTKAAAPEPSLIEQGTLMSSQTSFDTAVKDAAVAAKTGEQKPEPKNAPIETAQTMAAAEPVRAAAPAAPAAEAAAAHLQRVAAELGAHSATNFYKGLGGNDVVDSGGIFVATYQVPPVGKNVLIRVSLPGGYEFEAKGVVRWTCEPSPNSRGEDISPGFGAQFTEISPEARQLVYRYARNREPLFHDDF